MHFTGTRGLIPNGQPLFSSSTLSMEALKMGPTGHARIAHCTLHDKQLLLEAAGGARWDRRAAHCSASGTDQTAVSRLQRPGQVHQGSPAGRQLTARRLSWDTGRPGAGTGAKRRDLPACLRAGSCPQAWFARSSVRSRGVAQGEARGWQPGSAGLGGTRTGRQHHLIQLRGKDDEEDPRPSSRSPPGCIFMIQIWTAFD